MRKFPTEEYWEHGMENVNGDVIKWEFEPPDDVSLVVRVVIRPKEGEELVYSGLLTLGDFPQPNETQ